MLMPRRLRRFARRHPHRVSLRRYLFGAVATTLIAAALLPVWAQTTGAASTVSGRVTVAGGKRLPPMIVYLEPADEQQTFPTPTEPVVVSQKGAKFAPDFVVVAVGQTIVFPNDEDRPIEHNVFSRSRAKSFDLGLYRPSEQKSVTFDKPGVVRLFCSIHRYMNGVVFVAPSPFFSHVADDGRYRIDGVPPGRYVARTWQRVRRYPEQKSTLDLQAGGTGTVDWELKRK